MSSNPRNGEEPAEESTEREPVDSYYPYHTDDSYTAPEDNQAPWR